MPRVGDVELLEAVGLILQLGAVGRSEGEVVHAGATLVEGAAGGVGEDGGVSGSAFDFAGCAVVAFLVDHFVVDLDHAFAGADLVQAEQEVAEGEVDVAERAGVPLEDRARLGPLLVPGGGDGEVADGDRDVGDGRGVHIAFLVRGPARRTVTHPPSRRLPPFRSVSDPDSVPLALQFGASGGGKVRGRRTVDGLPMHPLYLAITLHGERCRKAETAARLAGYPAHTSRPRLGLGRLLRWRPAPPQASTEARVPGYRALPSPCPEGC